jgi:biopolymer transport protein ExbB/TolQ
MNSQSVQFAVIVLATVAMIACALSVFAAWRASQWASQLRSMTSLLAELHEIRDYVAKLDKWAKRINLREVQRERNEDGTYSVGKPNGSSKRVSLSAAESKDELRRRAGITAGRPAPHRGEP